MLTKEGGLSMQFTARALVASIIAFGLAACATTALDPAAQSVKVISQDQAHACKFLDAISANNGNTLSKDPETDARNQAKNKVARLGGNALLIKNSVNQIAPSGVGSIFSLSAEAYACA
jgi:hypothetical protein